MQWRRMSIQGEVDKGEVDKVVKLYFTFPVTTTSYN